MDLALVADIGSALASLIAAGSWMRAATIEVPDLTWDAGECWHKAHRKIGLANSIGAGAASVAAMAQAVKIAASLII